MGVPKFAAWLTKKFPSMVLDRCPADVHGLYIDLNGLIHPCCHDEHDASVALRTEVEKMRSICLAIETLVVTVKPQQVVYIAIDGVAPRAKMNQQRARRYMSAGTPLTNTAKPVHGPGDEMSAGVVAAIEKEFTAAERTVAEKDLDDVQEALLGDVLYGGAVGGDDTAAAIAAMPPAVVVDSAAATSSEVPNGGRFDSNCISPGTAFMDTVAATVRDFVRRKMSAAAVAAGASGAKTEGDDPLTATATATAAPPLPAVSNAASPWANLTVVFSDSATAGEGEHKFLDFLRTQSAYPGFNGGGCHVIAGLDADLIFLSLSLHIPRIVILRDHERSSYEKALLPVAQGGTVTAKKGKPVAAVVPHSDSTSSIGSAAVVAADAGDFSSTPLPSEMEGEETTATDAISVTTGGSPSAASSPPPPPQSPTAAAAATAAPPAPPHIATVAADVCTSYEYYDMDVVGSSLVSEIYQLCLEKGMEVKGDPLANPMNCTASNGFVFHHGGQSAAAAAAAKRDAPTQSNAAESAASQPPPPHASPAFHPCTATSNSKIIDDFIVLGMLLGNDFLPHSPSVYCGESAMDTLLDVYVGSVLPYGYLTGGNYEIQLPQVERLFRAYAGVEALRFRQRAIQAGTMTPQEAATLEVYSAADRRCWRDTYVRTTSLKDEAGVQAACRAYVEGLRFVWRYYCSISLQVSWSWYFPFHHAPLALDVADFLRAQGPDVQTALAPPKLERLPPTPFCQLLCILPPRSRLLVPSALHAAMLHPTPELTDTFPTRWRVDFTGAYGKDHLAAVLLPFANLPVLQEVVAAQTAAYSESEKIRNTLQPTHLVLESRSASTEAEAPSASSTTNTSTTAAAAAAAAAVEKPAATSGKQPPGKSRAKRAVAAAAGSRGFRIQGGGLQPLPATETPVELQGCTAIACSALADTAPPLSRPRTYSHTVAIPNLTVLADGSRVPLDRRPPTRYGGGGRRRPFYGKSGGGGNRDDRKWDKDKGKPNAGGGDGGNSSGEAARPTMLFGEFAVALVLIAVLTSTVTVRRSTSLRDSLHLVLQLCGIACTVLGLIFALGLAVANKGRATGSGMHRHNIFTAFVDWECASCLSPNFSRNRRCFICRAPFDPHRCVALFSGRNAPEPPLMDPDHEAYAAWYGVKSM